MTFKEKKAVLEQLLEELLEQENYLMQLLVIPNYRKVHEIIENKEDIRLLKLRASLLRNKLKVGGKAYWNR